MGVSSMMRRHRLIQQMYEERVRRSREAAAKREQVQVCNAVLAVTIVSATVAACLVADIAKHFLSRPPR